MALILLCIIGFVVGGAWTIVPSFLKAYYGMNEIITSLMMAYLGINFANYLIKGPFLTDVGFVPQPRVMPFKYLLPYIPGTRIHFGIVIALVALAVVYYMQTRTAYGLSLRILGANPKAAVHAGINVKRDIMTAFALSGALIGLAAAVESARRVGVRARRLEPSLRHDAVRHRVPRRAQRDDRHPLRVLLRGHPDRRVTRPRERRGCPTTSCCCSSDSSCSSWCSPSGRAEGLVRRKAQRGTTADVEVGEKAVSNE